MPTGDIYLNSKTDSGSITTTTAGSGTWWEYTTPNYIEPITISTPFVCPTPINNNKRGGDNMRYLYEVILVNPKNDTFYVDRVVARSETSALMRAYEHSDFSSTGLKVEFDDLKTSCRILMEWKKKQPTTAVE